MSVFTNSASRAPEQAKAYIEAVLGLVDGEEPLHILRATSARLDQATAGLTAAQVHQPELPGKWSINDVLHHLADSELVWGWRLRLVLSQDRPPLSGYDQDAWAERLRYADGDPAEAKLRFDVLRRSHLVLLEGLEPQELQRVGIHVERGEESLAHMQRLYAGHDVLHLRQIERIRAAVAG